VERDKDEDGFSHQDGKRPRKKALFGGAHLTIETGSDFPIGVSISKPTLYTYVLTRQGDK
jgi:hypothetical protein